MTRPPDWMVMQLLEPERIESCEQSRRDKWGHIACTCRRTAGHLTEWHHDPHTGATWKDKTSDPA